MILSLYSLEEINQRLRNGSLPTETIVRRFLFRFECSHGSYFSRTLIHERSYGVITHDRMEMESMVHITVDRHSNQRMKLSMKVRSFFISIPFILFFLLVYEYLTKSLFFLLKNYSIDELIVFRYSSSEE